MGRRTAVLAGEFRTVVTRLSVPVFALLEFFERANCPFVVIDGNYFLEKEVRNNAVQLVIGHANHAVVLVNVRENVAAIEGTHRRGGQGVELDALPRARNIKGLIGSHADGIEFGQSRVAVGMVVGAGPSRVGICLREHQIQDDQVGAGIRVELANLRDYVNHGTASCSSGQTGNHMENAAGVAFGLQIIDLVLQARVERIRRLTAVARSKQETAQATLLPALCIADLAVKNGRPLVALADPRLDPRVGIDVVQHSPKVAGANENLARLSELQSATGNFPSRVVGSHELRIAVHVKVGQFHGVLGLAQDLTVLVPFISNGVFLPEFLVNSAAQRPDDSAACAPQADNDMVGDRSGAGGTHVCDRLNQALA